MAVESNTSHDQDSRWGKFREIVMTTNGVQYLTDYEMRADMGLTYGELGAAMSNWGFRLHTKGHVMSVDELGLIFEKGLLTWYVKYFTSLITEILNFKSATAKAEAEHPTFWQFKKFAGVAQRLGYEIPKSLENIYTYQNYQKHFCENGFKFVSFKQWLIGTDDAYADYKALLKFIYDHRVKSVQKLMDENELKCDLNLQRFDKIKQKFKLDPGTIVDLLKKQCPSMMNMGVVFQRWKIVIEKISSMYNVDIFRNNDDLMAVVHENIIVLDRIITRLQELIFYTVRHMCTELIARYINGTNLDSEFSPIKIYEKTIYCLIDRVIKDPNHVLNRPVPMFYAFKYTELIPSCEL